MVARWLEPGKSVTAPLRTFRQIRSGEDVIHLAVRLGLLAFLVYWSFILVQPFVAILAWSAVLAVALYPAFEWLSKRLGGRPKLAATIVTALCLVIVIGPVAWLGFGLIDGLTEISEQFSHGRFAVPSPPAGLADWPIVGRPVHELWSKASTNLDAVLRQLAPYLKPVAGYLLAFAGGLGIGALKFLLSVILAGFLFPSGPKLVLASRGFLSHVVAQRSGEFLVLAGATIRSVSQGVIGIAIFQSLLIGLALKVAGVPYASVLSFAVLVLGILQIGSLIILLPVVIWIWSAKDFAIALPITIFLVLAGISDNVLKPLLMGRGLTTPMPVIFIGLIGGTLAHGIVGLFVGPIILAVAWELMTAWIREDRVAPAGTAGDAPSES
jgi:predicted PurR-regulated permease PerM